MKVKILDFGMGNLMSVSKAIKYLGYDCEIINNDLLIKPSNSYKIKNNNIRTDFDHRIAMSFTVMGSKVGNLKIEDSNSINTSFPNFVDVFNKAGGNIL